MTVHAQGATSELSAGSGLRKALDGEENWSVNLTRRAVVEGVSGKGEQQAVQARKLGPDRFNKKLAQINMNVNANSNSP